MPVNIVHELLIAAVWHTCSRILYKEEENETLSFCGLACLFSFHQLYIEFIENKNKQTNASAVHAVLCD